MRADQQQWCAVARPSRNSGDVTLYEEGTKPTRPYTVVANVRVWGRILTAISSRPTRADVAEELRAKAAKLGADAVINVQYHTSRAGVWPRGYMDASGQAVVFSAPLAADANAGGAILRFSRRPAIGADTPSTTLDR